MNEVDSPWFRDSVVGVATLMLKSNETGGGSFAVSMLRIIDAVTVSPPLTACTVIGKLPVPVEFVVVSVRVELNGGL